MSLKNIKSSIGHFLATPMQCLKEQRVDQVAAGLPTNLSTVGVDN
jgi:RNase H-fold protein (predicted Holliday junction resolvase)